MFTKKHCVLNAKNRVREAVPIILKKEGLYGRNERSYAC